MKSCFFLILLFLICSCGSNQSASSNKENKNAIVINTNIDCSNEVRSYAENSYRLHGQMNGGAFKGQDGSYTVRFSKPNPVNRNYTLSSRFQIWVDENCKVVNSKQLGTRF